MFVILSGKYVEQDLRIEFGAIPPTFLSVGNQRLYKYQVESIKKNNPASDIYMTLPKGFDVPKWDLEELNALGVKLIWSDPDYSLGQSIAFALSTSIDSYKDKLVTIYYGDTLLNDELTSSEDVIYTAKSDYNYIWFNLNEMQDINNIFCGVLSVSKPNALIKSLISESFDFEAAIKKYNCENEFKIKQNSNWQDFGHLNTYYDSKTIVTTERAFNSLKITKDYVTKCSKKKYKLEAEANWFKKVPKNLETYTPRLYTAYDMGDEFTYTLEYLYHPTLTEMFVYGNHPKYIWERIIESCFHFIDDCCENENENENEVGDSFYELLKEKNIQRLDEFLQNNMEFSDYIFDEDGAEYNLRDMLAYCHSQISGNSKVTTVHGDFCFSNILFDFRKKKIKVIDPRGIDFKDELSIYGDIRYDLAKLCHSVIGKYDCIVSDRFDVTYVNNNIKLSLADTCSDLNNIFKRYIECRNFNYHEIIALTVTLFLSMLPLHYDRKDRQIAFIATAINLYKELRK